MLAHGTWQGEAPRFGARPLSSWTGLEIPTTLTSRPSTSFMASYTSAFGMSRMVVKCGAHPMV